MDGSAPQLDGKNATTGFPHQYPKIKDKQTNKETKQTNTEKQTKQ